MYKFLCKDNKYTEYQYVETKTFQPIGIIEKTPNNMKLFVNDIFDYDTNTNTHKIIHSNFRANKTIPGILNLRMTHGKDKHKFLYLCKPDDKRIPFFLIPYTKKQDFDKSLEKIYITFEFKHWDFERPYGTMTQNLGNVVELNHYYEYILYCKSLNISIQQFTKNVKEKIQKQSNKEIIDKITEKYNLEKRTKKDYYIFTLDSHTSNDYDDAISYCEKEHKISIYISNVALIMDELDLWKAVSKRIATIYLPDKKRTMLPTLLNDMLCSLKEKQEKLCYVLDLFYNDKNEIISHSFGCCNAYIRKNVGYKTIGDFEKMSHFQSLMKILGIKHAKQVVTRLMLLFNHYVGRDLWKKQKGIYKSLYQESTLQEKETHNIPEHIFQHICVLKNKGAKYSLYDPSLQYYSVVHKDIDVYAQATSPIRRLVDLLNNIMIVNELTQSQLNDKSIEFYNYWTSPENIENINISSRAIRKIQSKCYIYKQYEENRLNGHDVYYKGYVFDKMYKEGDGKYQYMVYIESLGLTTSVTLTEDFNNYSCHLFLLYVFMSEENDKKKIKLQLCYESN